MFTGCLVYVFSGCLYRRFSISKRVNGFGGWGLEVARHSCIDMVDYESASSSCDGNISEFGVWTNA
jgi:hypothetical protein